MPWVCHACLPVVTAVISSATSSRMPQGCAAIQHAACSCVARLSVVCTVASCWGCGLCSWLTLQHVSPPPPTSFQRLLPHKKLCCAVLFCAAVCCCVQGGCWKAGYRGTGRWLCLLSVAMTGSLPTLVHAGAVQLTKVDMHARSQELPHALSCRQPPPPLPALLWPRVQPHAT